MIAELVTGLTYGGPSVLASGGGIYLVRRNHRDREVAQEVAALQRAVQGQQEALAKFETERDERVRARDLPVPRKQDTSWFDIIGIPIDDWMTACPYGMPFDLDKFKGILAMRDSGEYARRAKQLELVPPIDLSRPLPRGERGKWNLEREKQRQIEKMMLAERVPPPLLGSSYSIDESLRAARDREKNATACSCGCGKSYFAGEDHQDDHSSAGVSTDMWRQRYTNWLKGVSEVEFDAFKRQVLATSNEHETLELFKQYWYREERRRKVALAKAAKPPPNPGISRKWYG